MSKAIIYTRVSTEEQVTNRSLATQRQACEEFCDRTGLEVYRVYSDEGESAKTAQRTALQAMIEFVAREAKKVGITTVVVYRVDRFSRNQLDHQTVRAILRSKGVGLKSVTEPFDESPSGNFMETMLAAVAQFDNEVRAARTRDGMMAALSAGRWLWQPPLGYAKSLSPEAPSLVHDPASAPLVVAAFDLLALGSMSQSEVLSRVTDMGLRTRKGKKLSPQAFGQLLRNPLYCGRVISRTMVFEGPGDFEPIVSQEVFNAVQDVLSGRRPSKSRRYESIDFPLRRIVHCGVCGYPLTGSYSTGRNRNRRYGYYFCYHCGDVRVAKDRLERHFVENLESVHAHPEVLDLLDAVVREEWKGRSRIALAQERSIRAKLEELQGRENRLIDAYIHERKIDQGTFDAQKARLSEERAALERTLAASKPLALDLDATMKFAREVLGDLAGCWNRLDPDQRPTFASALYPNGIYFEDGFIGTAQNSWVVGGFWQPSEGSESLAAPTGFEPVSPP